MKFWSCKQGRWVPTMPCYILCRGKHLCSPHIRLGDAHHPQGMFPTQHVYYSSLHCSRSIDEAGWPQSLRTCQESCLNMSALMKLNGRQPTPEKHPPKQIQFAQTVCAKLFCQCSAFSIRKRRDSLDKLFQNSLRKLCFYWVGVFWGCLSPS